MPAPAGAPPRAPLAITPDQAEFTSEQLQALQTLGNDTIEAPKEWKDLFFYRVITSGLDPFREQIRLLRRTEPVAKNGRTVLEERYSIEGSVHGFRILARRAADAANLRLDQPAPMWFDDRSGIWRDAWPYTTPPPAAKYVLAIHHLDNRSETAVGIAHFSEYAKTTFDGDGEYTPGVGADARPHAGQMRGSRRLSAPVPRRSGVADLHRQHHRIGQDSQYLTWRGLPSPQRRPRHLRQRLRGARRSAAAPDPCTVTTDDSRRRGGGQVWRQQTAGSHAPAGCSAGSGGQDGRN